MNNTNVNNTSYEGSLGRQYCIPSGTDYYVYDSTVTSTTEGTYYVHDTTIGVWETKTLPAEYVDTADYYTKNTTSGDGSIYAGIPADLMNNFVVTKQKTWVGYTNQERKLQERARRSSTNIITTNDKVFILSAHRVFGDSIIESSEFCYNNMNGPKYKYFKEYTEYVGNVLGRDSYWVRDPSVTNYNEFCRWYYNGYSEGYYASATNKLLVCACQ